MKPTSDITHFHKDTCAEVRQILSDLHRSGERVRLFYGDPKTGKAWPETTGVFGRIGSDPGAINVAILLTLDGNPKGCPVLDSSIVGVLGRAGKWHYRHPTLDVGVWAIVPSPNDDYIDAVTHNGNVIELFKNVGQSRRFRDYMTGRRTNR